MLLSITDKCMMNCSHCLSNCEPEGTDMSMEVLDDIIQFINHPELRFRVILVSGGEPTEHPRLFDILDRLYETNTQNKWGERKAIILATNGMFLNRNEKPEGYQIVREFTGHLLSYKDLRIQLTADPRFYKTQINEKNLKYLKKKARNLLLIENTVTLLADYRRATTGTMPKMNYRTAPFCFNARSMANNGYTFPMIVEHREVKNNKFCAIGFDMQGNIRISESLTCAPIGNVNTPMHELVNSIRELRCQSCSAFKQLSPAHRNAIGM